MEPQPGAPPSPRAELDSLLDAAMRKALRLVQEGVSHLPFALAITTAGEQVEITGDVGDAADPQACHERILQRIAEAIAAGRYRALALARNIELTHTVSGRRTDAVQVTLDHVAGPAVTCTMPYDLRLGRLSTGELVATAPVARFFAGR